MDCSLPASSVFGIFHARILDWVAMSSSRGSSRPRNQTLISCIVFFTIALSLTFFFKFYFYIILLYNTILVLPYIGMNQPRVYMSSQSWTFLPLYIISLDHPRAPAPSILYPVSNIDWWFVSYMIVYTFQCHSPKSSLPLPLPQSPKDCSIHLCLFCCLTYISCLTTSNLPWFIDLTFQVPMQYYSLQHWTLLPSPVMSTTKCCFCFSSICSFFLEIFLHWSPVAYWAPTDLGSSSFSVLSFCLFILFMGRTS